MVDLIPHPPNSYAYNHKMGLALYLLKETADECYLGAHDVVVDLAENFFRECRCNLDDQVKCAQRDDCGCYACVEERGGF